MKTEILQSDDAGLRVAVQALIDGECVAIPTETVYGLGGVSFRAQTLTKIFQAKNRPSFDPLIVHVEKKVSTLEALGNYGVIDYASMPSEQREMGDLLMQKFWPGPLTLVLPKHSRIPDLATSGLASVAVRMPAHPVAQTLLQELGMPLCAPSANRFGRISPTTAKAVYEELNGRIPYIVDGGPCMVGLESTVLAVGSRAELVLLRPGAVSVEAIEREAGRAVVRAIASSPGQAVAAPGMLASHYAPAKGLTLLPGEASRVDEKWWQTNLKQGELAGIFLLSSNEAKRAYVKKVISQATGLQPVLVSASEAKTAVEISYAEVARSFFQCLRDLDASAATTLFSEPCSESDGLGFAIQDRLRRASTKA